MWARRMDNGAQPPRGLCAPIRHRSDYPKPARLTGQPSKGSASVSDEGLGGQDRNQRRDSSILPTFGTPDGLPMPTTRETVLAALQARLLPLAALTLRDEVLPERIPAAGLIILRDGQPGEPEVTLSPLRYHYQHRAEIEAVVQGADRDAAFDTLCASVGAAVAADRTLGGLCDWIEAEAPRPVDRAVEGATSMKAAVIPVILPSSRADPLG